MNDLKAEIAEITAHYSHCLTDIWYEAEVLARRKGYTWAAVEWHVEHDPEYVSCGYNHD